MVDAALQRFRAITVRWRVPLVLAGAAVFFIGLGVSFHSLGLTVDQLSLWPIVLTLVLLAPLTLALGAVSLQQSARAVSRRIGLRDAIAVSAISRIAEVLPLPGGALMRGAALMRAGAGLGESAWIVTLTALLTLSIAAVLGAVPLVSASPSIGYTVLAAGLASSFTSAALIMRRAAAGLTLAMIAVRVAVVAVGIGRVSAAFAAIGAPLEPVDASLFVICATLGTAVAIIPAGLGVSESLAAALALLVQVPPAAAFLAIALNRVVGLATSGIFALVLGPDLLKSTMRSR